MEKPLVLKLNVEGMTREEIQELKTRIAQAKIDICEGEDEFRIKVRTKGMTTDEIYQLSKKIGMIIKGGDKTKRIKNIFGLFSRIEGWKGATIELKEAINKFVEEYREIKEAYPNVGIGDTATDDLIVDEIYSKIHWRK